MSGGSLNLQAQVEAVLAPLIVAAARELTRLFESHCGATQPGLELQPDRGHTQAGLESLSSRNTKRSVGVQVDGDMCGQPEPLAPSMDLCEVVEVVIPAETLHFGGDGPLALDWSPLQEQVVVELSAFKLEASTDAHSLKEDVLHGEDKKLPGGPEYGALESSPDKVLVLKPDKVSGKKVQLICPLLSKVESSELLAKEAPQPASISPTSPSLPDSTISPAPEQSLAELTPPHPPEDPKSPEVRPAPLDNKLLQSCSVQLVDMVAPRPSRLKPEGRAAAAAAPLPKDIRQHQGPHTGRRLCCYTPCGDGVWRLQQVEVHPRFGYICGVCKKTFKRRKILRRHKRFHTGERPYSCSTCSKSFVLRKTLRRHMRFHTGERPHTCTQCSKSFRLRENLKAHLRFHTGEKPFSCPTCGKSFRIMRNLQKHGCEFFVPSFRAIAGL